MEELFSNAGQKIRRFAIALFLGSLFVLGIGAIGIVIAAVQEGVLETILGLLIAAVEFLFGAFAAYILSLFLVAFGDLVQETAENRRINALILDRMTAEVRQTAPMPPAQRKADSQPVAPVQEKKNEEPVQPAADEQNASFWVCGNCKTKNLSSRTDCWACGRIKVTNAAKPEEPASEDFWFCPVCGSKNLESNSACNKCGSSK